MTPVAPLQNDFRLDSVGLTQGDKLRAVKARRHSRTATTGALRYVGIVVFELHDPKIRPRIVSATKMVFNETYFALCITKRLL